jgi:hypothetical protein
MAGYNTCGTPQPAPTACQRWRTGSQQQCTASTRQACRCRSSQEGAQGRTGWMQAVGCSQRCNQVGVLSTYYVLGKGYPCQVQYCIVNTTLLPSLLYSTRSHMRGVRQTLVSTAGLIDNCMQYPCSRATHNTHVCPCVHVNPEPRKTPHPCHCTLCVATWCV